VEERINHIHIELDIFMEDQYSYQTFCNKIDDDIHISKGRSSI